MRKYFLVIAFLFMAVFGMAFSHLTTLPKLSFSTWDGKTYSFSDFKGKVVVVNFFASYCPPCMVELKELAKLYKKYKDDGLVVVGFMVDQEGRPLLPQIVEAKGITYPVGMGTEEILKAFGDPPITPTSFLVDREGRVVKRIFGYAGRKYLEKKIQEYLEK